MYPIGHPIGYSTWHPHSIHRAPSIPYRMTLASDGLPHPRLCFVLAAHSPSPLSDSPPKSTNPSQNDCLIELCRPNHPTHFTSWVSSNPCSSPLTVLSHSISPLSDTQAKSTNPSQNDCLSILDTPSIPPIQCHRPTQILALAHPFSLPFKYKSSQRHPSQKYKAISK